MKLSNKEKGFILLWVAVIFIMVAIGDGSVVEALATASIPVIIYIAIKYIKAGYKEKGRLSP